jgi:hypothetical protein
LAAPREHAGVCVLSGNLAPGQEVLFHRFVLAQRRNELAESPYSQRPRHYRESHMRLSKPCGLKAAAALGRQSTQRTIPSEELPRCPLKMRNRRCEWWISAPSVG